MNKKNLFSQPFKRVSKEIIVLFHIMGKYLIFICLWFGDRPFSELLRVFKLRCLQLHISLVTEVKPRTIRFRKHTSDCVFWLQLHVRHRVVTSGTFHSLTSRCVFWGFTIVILWHEVTSVTYHFLNDRVVFTKIYCIIKQVSYINHIVTLYWDVGIIFLAHLNTILSEYQYTVSLSEGKLSFY